MKVTDRVNILVVFVGKKGHCLTAGMDDLCDQTI
jgi:hypothetical protein